MKIKYLGTAAFEGVPALFCTCRVCRRSMELGGRNLRSRSQALINDDLLIDFPADTVWHSQRYGIDWTKIGDCIITHSHSDHLYPKDVVITERTFSNEHRLLHFFAGQDGYEKLNAEIGSAPAAEIGATVSLVEPGKRFWVGENKKYSVLPLRANHDVTSSPVIYSITCGEKKILYAHDSGVFYEDVWRKMRTEGKYDLVSLDCCGCLADIGRDNHMSFGTNLEMLERMRQEKLIDEKTVVVINHFSHNGGQTYEEMVPEAQKEGILVAYDGMEIEV